ncbi:MAG: hypothetical protein JW702_01325 [Clostridiales bacterium]|nr:hypothetical protein [Clostridiales bacterium]
MRIIVGIKVSHRSDEAKQVQEILTKYGCIIKTRLGLHDAGSECSDEGLILLELLEKKDQVAVEYFMEEMLRLEDVVVKRMDF